MWDTIPTSRTAADQSVAARNLRGIPVSDPSFYTKLGRLSAIITILPATMAVGWIAGYYLVDRNFDTFPWGSVILCMIGAGVGFYEIVRILTAGGGRER